MTIDYSNKKFLLVDDFEKFRSVLKSLVQLCGGKNIELSHNGADAIKRIQDHPVDIVLCDYHLGQGKNGQQVLEQIRHENLLPESSVFLMVTAESSSEMVINAIECQPDGYLMKPFNQAMLKTRLNKIIEIKEIFKPIYEAISENLPDKAISCCHVISKEHPKYISLIKKTEASLFMKKKNYLKAKEIYEAVLAIRSLPWAEIGLGQVYFFLENYKESIQIFQNLIAHNKLLLQAYDWLAKALMCINEDMAAEQILKQAIELSPQAILRQMDLGNLAYKNGDLTVAELSFRQAMKLGRNSCFKSPDNYTNLAKTLIPKMKSDNDLVRKTASDETFFILKEVRTEYQNDKNIAIQAMLLETESYQTLKEKNKATMSLNMATELYKIHGNQASTETKLNMTKCLSSMGEQEAAEEIANELMADNSENIELLKTLSSFIETSPINAKGIDFYKKEKYKEAIDAFEEACLQFPNSISINLNAIQAIIQYMALTENNPVLIQQCDQHFEAIAHISPSDKRHKRYQELKKTRNKL